MKKKDINLCVCVCVCVCNCDIGNYLSVLLQAPEILLGRRYDSKADLWSVGTILFQCLAGNAPFLVSGSYLANLDYLCI